ncbi:MAG: hypothetical protein K2X43_24815 [Hyphomonadaceae bacterium]|jgi:hypothetical protein|nr:hypothetical protein [Hyphomonadaceae bacterium]
MSKIGARAISALLLTAALALLFWLRPGVEPAMLGATTPESTMLVFSGLFLVFWAYLVVQGYPISHGDIGSASTHNLDNIISGIPAIAALFGIFVHFAGFWPLSQLNLLLAVMTLAVVIYDLWVLGGAAAKINRLTDEIKPER